MSNFHDVSMFHRRFGLEPAVPAPHLLLPELQRFRVDFMYEELEEYVAACNGEDLVKAADALLPFDELWKQVHAANMRKVRAEVPSDSKRGSTFDVVKPPGWVSPEAALYGILKAAGAKL